mgnify:CR=1 FL=1
MQSSSQKNKSKMPSITELIKNTPSLERYIVANIITRTRWAVPSGEYEGNKLLRSPMLVPPIREVYWDEQMAVISESNQWRNPEEVDTLAIIIMTFISIIR